MPSSATIRLRRSWRSRRSLCARTRRRLIMPSCLPAFTSCKQTRHAVRAGRSGRWSCTAKRSPRWRGVLKEAPCNAKARESLRDCHAAGDRAGRSQPRRRRRGRLAACSRPRLLAQPQRIPLAARPGSGTPRQARRCPEHVRRPRQEQGPVRRHAVHPWRAYARCGAADRAMAMLKEAVAAGYNPMHRADADLDPLRQRADFQALVAGLERPPLKK